MCGENTTPCVPRGRGRPRLQDESKRKLRRYFKCPCCTEIFILNEKARSETIPSREERKAFRAKLKSLGRGDDTTPDPQESSSNTEVDNTSPVDRT